MDHRTFIIAEPGGSTASQELLELVGFTRTLPGAGTPAIVLLGSAREDRAEETAARTGCPILALTGDHLGLYNTEAFCAAVLEALGDTGPAWICLAHTSTGIDLAPRLAFHLGAACITAVEGVSGTALTRAVCAGRYCADFTPGTACTVVTVVPGAFPPIPAATGTPGTVERRTVSPGPCRSRTLGITENAYRDTSLKDATVIVSAGRGMGARENISMIRELAGVFPRAAVGASRPVCDLGWLGYSHQVGSTGQTVSPKVYIACGISGAIQHLAGMKGSQLIIAINADPDAAIFRFSHYGIVEDLTTFLPILLEELRGG
jgi:electron transfer flavoprotein alpha subunit